MGIPRCFRHVGCSLSVFMTIAALIAFCVSSSKFAFSVETCASGVLLPGGSASTDLKIDKKCRVVGSPAKVGVYVFQNVNIVGPVGELTFEDTRIDFHAENIIVENGGKLVAGSILRPIGTNPPISGETGARLRIYLWGKQSDPGAACAGPRCGVPLDLWTSNDTLAMHMVPTPKNGKCTPASKFGPGDIPVGDCFYQYDSFENNKKPDGYFGHKVLALSYGGTLQLFGVKGATYDTQVDNTPSATGTSSSCGRTGQPLWRAIAGAGLRVQCDGRSGGIAGLSDPVAGRATAACCLDAECVRWRYHFEHGTGFFWQPGYDRCLRLWNNELDPRHLQLFRAVMVRSKL